MRRGFIIYKVISYIISIIWAFSKNSIIRLNFSLYPYLACNSLSLQRPNVLIPPLSSCNRSSSSGICSVGAFHKDMWELSNIPKGHDSCNANITKVF